MLKSSLFSILIFLSFSCRKETITYTSKCDCKNAIVGYFEMEDCQVYICSLPSTTPFYCTGGKLEVAVNFEMNRISFRSPVWKLCTAPVHLFACAGPCQPLQGYACEAYIFNAMLDPMTNELCLEIDDEFLPCSVGEDQGFWFALATE